MAKRVGGQGGSIMLIGAGLRRDLSRAPSKATLRQQRQLFLRAAGTDSFLLRSVLLRSYNDNLEAWRRADPGLKARFMDRPLLHHHSGSICWGKFCGICHHKRCVGGWVAGLLPWPTCCACREAGQVQSCSCKRVQQLG